MGYDTRQISLTEVAAGKMQKIGKGEPNVSIPSVCFESIKGYGFNVKGV